jgi:hypothetical protein
MANFETRSLHTTASFCLGKATRVVHDEYELGTTLGE